MAVLTTSLLNFWKFDLDPCELVCTSWADSTRPPSAPVPPGPRPLVHSPLYFLTVLVCESRIRSLAPSSKHLTRVCHPVGLQSKCMENIYPGIQAQVTMSVTLWGAALVNLQVEMSPRKGSKPRLACGPELVPTEAVSGHVGGSSAGHSALRPLLATTVNYCRFLHRKAFSGIWYKSKKWLHL